MRFRHLPVTNEQDATQNFEQLQALLVKLAAVPVPAETTAGNTKALKELLQALREG